MQRHLFENSLLTRRAPIGAGQHIHISRRLKRLLPRMLIIGGKGGVLLPQALLRLIPRHIMFIHDDTAYLLRFLFLLRVECPY